MTNQRSNKGTGLLALLGIGAGVYAWWKYKNMSPEKKQQLHAKVNDVGQKVKDTYADVESTVKDKFSDVESTVKNKYDEFKNSAKKEADHIQNDYNNVSN